ncbi:MAG TPA: hypothetical protein VKR60_11510 [Candidatus Sulfotelmatobacter sp.]|nr:hypothetical protein [Candidatus Sulfotelmatobacter sp.]
MKALRKLWQLGRNLLPVEGFFFDRPIVMLQSDDWGRAGLRDLEGLERLSAAGLVLGERPYDFYTLETAEDLAALRATLRRHRDSVGRCPSLEMNFIVANLDFPRMSTEGFQQIHLLPLSDGFPGGWNRPGLLPAYREGIQQGLFCAALHGTTHFCRAAIERHLTDSGERGALLRTLWKDGTPYIHWRMPWIGYEYWDYEAAIDDRFLPPATQRDLIGEAVGAFAKMFSTLPRSACAPGYRANDDTHRAWAQFGIRVAQNGPGTTMPPHFDHHGILQLYRTVEFEPAVDPSFSLNGCVRRAEACFESKIPAIVSVHSINFHSSVRDFRSRTLQLLDQFLDALQSAHPDLLYFHSGDLYELVNKGSSETVQGTVNVRVTQKRFVKSLAAHVQEA